MGIGIIHGYILCPPEQLFVGTKTRVLGFAWVPRAIGGRFDVRRDDSRPRK
jgi:hypothetical protein